MEDKEEKAKEARNVSKENVPVAERPILKQPGGGQTGNGGQQRGQAGVGGQQRYPCDMSASETDSQREAGVTFHKNGTPNGKVGGRAEWCELKDIKVVHPVSGAQQRLRPPVPIRQHTTMCSEPDRKTDSLLRQVELRQCTQWRVGPPDNSQCFHNSEYRGLGKV